MKKCENCILFHDYKDIEGVVGKCSHSFPMHIHEHYCVGFITNGSAVFEIENRKRILFAGDCYIIPPYALHTLTSIDGEVFNYCVLVASKNPLWVDFRGNFSLCEEGRAPHNYKVLCKRALTKQNGKLTENTPKLGFLEVTFCVSKMITSIKH